MKIKSEYRKITIIYQYDLDKLIKNNDLKPIDEIEFSLQNMQLDFKIIPQSVSALKFNYKFLNLPCEIPPNIKYVYFHKYTNLLEELPNTIEHIVIYRGFNHPVDKLGDHLKSINFGCDFNQPVDNLPSSLEKVVFNSSFTYPINNLPSNIKFIHILNSNYDFTSIKTLPKSIILLQLGINNHIDWNNGIEFDLGGKKFISPAERKYDEKSQTLLKDIYFF